jgi:hypothetical protein
MNRDSAKGQKVQAGLNGRWKMHMEGANLLLVLRMHDRSAAQPLKRTTTLPPSCQRREHLPRKIGCRHGSCLFAMRVVALVSKMSITASTPQHHVHIHGHLFVDIASQARATPNSSPSTRHRAIHTKPFPDMLTIADTVPHGAKLLLIMPSPPVHLQLQR